MHCSQVGVSPPKLGGVAVRSRKVAIATSARTDGVVPNSKVFGTHSETLRLWEPPRLLPLRRLARNFLEVASTPPNLGGDTPDCDIAWWENLCS